MIIVPEHKSALVEYKDRCVSESSSESGRCFLYWPANFGLTC